MHVLRAYFFATYAALGAVLPLLALAFEARGFRPSAYGWLLALLPLARLVAPPLWGALADRYFGTIRLLRLNSALAALAMGALAATHVASVTIVAFALWAFASSALQPLAEAGAYRLLGSRASGFGYVRLFGSIGFAVTAFALSVVGVDGAVTVPFGVCAAAYTFTCFVSFRMKEAGAPARAPLRAELGGIARRPETWLLWLGAVFYYFAHGAFDAYFGPYARTLPGVTAESVSGGWALGVTCEVIALACVPWLLQSRLRGTLLIGSALVAVLRWWLIAEATSAHAIWLQQPLHAITFGVWYLAFVHENQARAAPSVRATVQGVASACVGLGMVLATLLGGYVLEQLGGRVLFRLASGSAMLAVLTYMARAWIVRRKPSGQHLQTVRSRE